MLTHQGWLNLLIYATFTCTTNYRVCNLHIYLYLAPPVTLLPPVRSIVPRLGLGITWVRQLRSGSCHYPTAATKCNTSLQANKPHRWKSMLTHQGWFILLIYATFTGTTNYRVCNLHIYLYLAPRTHTSRDARLDKKGLKCNLPNIRYPFCNSIVSFFDVLFFSILLFLFYSSIPAL